ncbi:hypothetical protein DFH07DRAFT_737928 [Mycena maculata]|uniref:DUF676 domain-containing protein n=1 Tax=Mycena maculata TaxID=230809 RepID=A0AAD7NL70_9AGAR|nr:hypothetical protein DFH07DRAFT_737928 [Mycena maculata]
MSSWDSAPTDLTIISNLKLLVIFIHGFKGTDETFGAFPERLQNMLSETIPHASVECVVFPAYETKGDLVEAVVKFSDWLTTLTVEKEVATGGGAGKAKIVLCGHSMGGLLAADTLQEFIKSRPDPKAPLWPHIVALIAFDTPYLGLHPGVLKNSATKAVEYAQTARAVGTSMFGALAGFGASKAAGNPTPPKPATPAPAAASGWGKWAGPATYAVGGALLAGAAAGATYYKREDLGLSITWATDHMKYVGHLWDVDALNRRMDFLVNAEAQEGVIFRNFYTFLPPTPLLHDSARTFVVLPKKNAPAEPYFILARNGLAPNEVDAHTGMFAGKTNDGFYDLGLLTAQLIREAVIKSHAAPTPSGTSVDTKTLAFGSRVSDLGSRATPPPNTVNSAWDELGDHGATAPPSSPRTNTETSPWAKTSTPAEAATSEWGKEWQ